MGRIRQESRQALDLLISPYRGRHAGMVASAINEGLGEKDTEANISYLQGIVAARLSFTQLLRVVVPKTKWWFNNEWDQGALLPTSKKKGAYPWTQPSALKHKLNEYTLGQVEAILKKILESARAWLSKIAGDAQAEDLQPLDRFVALTALILWAGKANFPQARRPLRQEITAIRVSKRRKAPTTAMPHSVLPIPAMQIV